MSQPDPARNRFVAACRRKVALDAANPLRHDPGMTEHLTAPAALTAWLDREERGKSWLARKLGVNRSTVWRWERGDCLPDTAARAMVETLTGGAVPASAWVDK